MEIRNIVENDLSEISNIDALAFNAVHTDGTLRKRTIKSLIEGLRINPDGCFLAVESKSICGYIFSRVWGKVGWLGVFGVSPEFQNKGIGQKLLTTTIDGLKEKGCDTIGLETMPESSFNVGFYLKMGFKMVFPTIHFKRSVGISTENLFPKSIPPKSFSIEIFKKASQIVKGLDYIEEIRSVESLKWGKVLIFGNSGRDGFSILRTEPVHETNKKIPLVVQMMILSEKRPSLYSSAIKEIEEFAFLNDFNEIIISANSSNTDFLNWITLQGFQVIRTRVRMIFCGEYVPVNGIDASKWAM